MTKFVHVHVGGRWVVVQGPCRCSECGGMVATTRRWYPEPATWTLALCEPCVQQLIKEES